MNQYRLVSATEKTISNGREEFVSSQTGLWMLVMMVLSYVWVNGGADISSSLLASQSRVMSAPLLVWNKTRSLDTAR